MHESIIGRLHSNGSVLRESGSELAREWFSFADKVALLNRNIHIPIKNDSTPEIVRLYTPHESWQKNATLQKNLARYTHPILQTARNEQKQTISAHISALAEKLISKEKDIHLDAHWNNESEIKDKAKNAEDIMYQGWSL